MRVRSFGWPGVAAGVSVIAVAAFLVAGWWQGAVAVVAIVQAAIVVLLARWSRGSARKRALERTRQENRESIRSLEAAVARSAESTRVAVTGLGEGLTSSAGTLTAIDGHLTTLDQRVAVLDQRVAVLDGRMTELDGKLTALDGKLRALDGTLSAADGRIGTVVDSLASVGETLTSVDGRVAGVESKVRPLTFRHQHQMAQMEGLFQLYVGELTGGEGHANVMPASGGWAMDPVNLAAALHVIERQRPNVVVEFGGGTSTVWIAKLLRRLGSGRVVSVDHDAEFADATRTVVERLGLGDLVDIRVVDLVPAGLEGHDTPWYDASALDDIDSIDVILVDGPPGKTGPSARYPALPRFIDRMADGAVILVDDTSRPEETEMVDRWKSDHPVLREEVPVPRAALRILRKGDVTPA